MSYIVPIKGELGVEFKYETLLLMLNAAKNSESIHLVIDSPGGFVDEAEKMRNALLKSGKKIIASNNGDVASAAVGLFLLGDERIFYSNKGVFLIHNPWAEIKGEASDFSYAASEMKKMEDRYAKIYAERTGSDINVLKEFMKENKPLTPEQVQELGFATVKTFEPKAVAKLNLNNNKMEIQKEFEKMEKSIISKIKGFISPKMLMIADADGNELEMPNITDANEIAVGVKVNVGGSPFTGESTQPDGTVIVAEDGVITEVREPVDEMAELKAENEALKEQIAQMKSESEEIQENAKQELESIKSEFAQFKARMTKFKPEAPTPPSEPTKKTFTFKRK